MGIQIHQQIDEVCGPEIHVQYLSSVVCRRIRQATPGYRGCTGGAKVHLVVVSCRVTHGPGEIPIVGPVYAVLVVFRHDLEALALKVIDDHRLSKSDEWLLKDTKIERSGSGNLDRLLMHAQRRRPAGWKYFAEQRVWIDY